MNDGGRRRIVNLVAPIAAGRSGVPRYAAALVSALDRVAGDIPDLALVVVATPPAVAAIAPRTLHVRELRWGRGVTAGPRRVLLDQIAAATSAGDLDHHFDLTGTLLRPRRRFVTTIHDASVTYAFTPRRYLYKRAVSRLALRRAAAAVAVSAFAREEAIERFGADGRKITVIHSGPGLVAPPVDARPRTGAQPTLLYVGALGRNKNVPFLVDAFDAAGVEGRLVVVGSGDEEEAVRTAIARMRGPGRAELRRAADDAELEELYMSATALALPSTYEGFGFTALEAMARGLPVISSDIPALREIAGEGAALVAPSDVGAWATAVASVLTDARVRDDLRARGTRVVARYSWHATARSLCELFRSTLSRAPT